MANIAVRSAFIAGVLVWVGSLAGQAPAETITVPLTRPGEPMSLDIELLSAHIEVIGEERKDVQLAVTLQGGERKITTPSGVKSLGGSSGALQIEERDNQVSVESEMPLGRSSIVARVPRRANLSLSTVQNGEIVVRNVTGTLQLQNVNGPITATNIDGAVIAESVTSAINVGFTAINPSEATSLSSISGGITLALPAKAGAELRLDSGSGQIDSAFELDVKPSKPAVVRNEGRNGVSVRVEDIVTATINGGGPVIKLKTLNGPIRIEKAN